MHLFFTSIYFYIINRLFSAKLLFFKSLCFWQDIQKQTSFYRTVSCKKWKIFLQCPLTGDIPFSKMNIRNSDKGGESVLDHAFQRRREIERMLLSGKKLTVSELMGRYCVGRKSISRDFEVIGEALPVISKQGYNGGYFLMDGVGEHQNSLSQEQLECLERIAVSCEAQDRETVLTIIHEFGPYDAKHT